MDCSSATTLEKRFFYICFLSPASEKNRRRKVTEFLFYCYTKSAKWDYTKLCILFVFVPIMLNTPMWKRYPDAQAPQIQYEKNKPANSFSFFFVYLYCTTIVSFWCHCLVFCNFFSVSSLWIVNEFILYFSGCNLLLLFVFS